MSFVDLKTKLLHLYLTNIILQLLSERLWYVSESRRAKLHSFRASISYANLVIFFVQYKLYSIYLFTITTRSIITALKQTLLLRFCGSYIF